MLRRSGLAIAVFSALLALCFSSTASAQETIAVMKLDALPGGETAGDLLAEALKSEVRKSEYTLGAKGGDVMLADVQLIAECEDTGLECLGSVAAFLEADHIVFGTVDANGVAQLTWFKKNRGIEREVDGPATTPDEAGMLSRRLFSGAIGTIAVGSGDQPGAEVVIDGSPVGMTPYQAELTVGAHTVQVRKAGFKDSEIRSVDLKDGETSTVEFTLEQVAGGNVAGSMPPMAKIGFVVGGVGAAVMVGGVVTGVMTQSLQDDLEQDVTACRDNSDPTACSPSLHDTVDEGENMAMITNILLGVGGAAVATGVGLIIYGYMGADDEPAETAGDVDFAFSVAPDGAAALFRVRF